MEFSDPYAVENAFDDYYQGTAPGQSGIPLDGGYARAPAPRRRVFDAPLLASGIVSVVRRLRARPPMQVVGAEVDTTLYSFGVDSQVVGADASYPIFSASVEKFTGSPKLVRVDDEASYRAFRQDRRRPYVEDLERRLRALENAFRDHISDGHGGFATVLGDSVIDAAAKARAGGESIVDSGSVKCWQDGPEILCTLRFSSPAGARFLTSGLPVSPITTDVVRAAMAADAEPEELVGVASACVKAVGASELMTELREASSDVLAVCGAEIGVVALSSCADPLLCAAMSMLQRCQRGERAACFEVGRMSRSRGELLDRAYNVLLAAQDAKRAGRFPS